MAQGEMSLHAWVILMRRRRYWFLGGLALILLVSALLAFFLPPVYRSQSTILIEQQEIPQDIVRSAVTSFADQRVQMISQRVMTRANLLEIIHKFGLYPDLQKKKPDESLVKRMRDDMKLDMISADVIDPRSGRPTQATIAFALSYEYRSPDVAQKVTNELTTLYLNENVKNRTQLASGATDFLSEEADKLSKQTEQLEARLAAFKKQNSGKLPELTTMNLQMMDSTERELLNTQEQMRALEDRRILLEGQLAQSTPNEILYDENGQRVPGPAERLKTLRARLISLSALYGDAHPDVVRVRKEIAALSKQLGQGETAETRTDDQDTLVSLQMELAMAREKYSPDHPDVKRLERLIAAQTAASPSAPSNIKEDTTGLGPRPDNPGYIDVQTRLEMTRSEIDALAEQQKTLRAKVAEFERRLTQAPEVEKEYRALLRDYENTMAMYRATRAKQMEAQLSKSLEMERKGERFTLVEPPTLPEQPVSPNRPVIVVIGFIFSLMAGVGMAYLREKTDRSVWGEDYAGPVFALSAPLMIPYILNEDDARRRSRRQVIAVALVAICVVSTTVAVHFFYSPLDVLWFRLMR
jgi:succinoglycan biosynthesis transport protein ExoP